MVDVGIKLTDDAVIRVKELMEDEDNHDLAVRVFIMGGGCSGFQYRFALDEVKNSDDILVEKDGVKFFIDECSYQYLVGAEIDYMDSVDGAQFTIHNPSVSNTCGCGSSFSI